MLFQEMAKIYRSICNEIDLLLLQITNLVEKEIKYKLKIEKLMNNGFVRIAKARYIMGSTCVTKMQLPSESSNPIQPIATVCRAELNNHWVFHIHRKDYVKDPSKKVVESEKNVESSDDGKKNSSTNNNVADVNSLETNTSEIAFRHILQSNPKSLKQTKNAFSVKDTIYQECNEELLDEFSTDSDSNESLMSVTDPLRLFGVLVPSTLKEAQLIFKDVVNLIGKCATLQAELSEVLYNYNHLLNVKKLIEIAAEKQNLDIFKPKIYWTQSEISSIICHPSSDDEAIKTEEKENEVNVTKSIRSVFYNAKDAPESEMSIWGSDTKTNFEDN